MTVGSESPSCMRNLYYRPMSAYPGKPVLPPHVCLSRDACTTTPCLPIQGRLYYHPMSAYPGTPVLPPHVCLSRYACTIAPSLLLSYNKIVVFRWHVFFSKLCRNLLELLVCGEFMLIFFRWAAEGKRVAPRCSLGLRDVHAVIPRRCGWSRST